MVTIIFPDRIAEKRALPLIRERFAGRALGPCEHSVPEEALLVLADENIPFSVSGRTAAGAHRTLAAERREQAMALIQSCIDEGPSQPEGETNGYDLLRSLDDNRSAGERKLFPSELKGLSW